MSTNQKGPGDRVPDLSSSTDKLERKVKKLSKRLKNLEREHTELRVKVDLRDKRIEALSTALRQLISKVDQMESDSPFVE